MTVVGLDQNRLADTLREAGLVDEAELDRALKAEPAGEGERLDQRLLKMGLVDDDKLMQALAFQRNLSWVKVVKGLGDPKLFDLLDKDWARSHGVLPLYRVHGELTFAISDPTDIFTIDALSRLTGLQLRLVVAHAKEIETGISLATNTRPGFSVESIIGDVNAEEGVEVVDSSTDELENLEEMAGLSPVVKLVNILITEAIKKNSSDIHIEPGENTLRVRYRIDGMLRKEEDLQPKFGPALVSRIKIMAGLDIAERRVPQDGRIQVMYEGRSIDLRISTLPTYFGEKVVIRILDRSSVLRELSTLGITDRMLEPMQELVTRPNGVMLVTGPTGSGKTTTLYAALASINSIEQNICTVENPVEYSIPMINQVQTNERAGLTFANALRSLLRQDPDIIMVGEIRDRETAQIAIESALTGHLVFSTLHTNDAIAAVPRLVNMGIESYLLAAALNGVMSQRLVRRVCKACKVPMETDDRMKALFDRYKIEFKELVRGEGCAHCGGTGYAGRVGIHELFVIDDALRDIITKNPTLSALRREAKKQGHIDLASDGLDKVAQGQTTFEEVVRVAETA